MSNSTLGDRPFVTAKGGKRVPYILHHVSEEASLNVTRKATASPLSHTLLILKPGQVVLLKVGDRRQRDVRPRKEVQALCLSKVS